MAMGALSVSLSTMGARASYGTTAAIRGSEGYQDTQRRLMIQNTEKAIARIDNGKGVRNRLASGADKIGLNGVSKNLRASAQHSRTRLVDRYNRASMEDVKADAGGRLIKKGEPTYNAMVTKEQAHNINELAEAYKSNFESDGIADNVDRMSAEHASALWSVMANSNDQDARAKLMATH